MLPNLPPLTTLRSFEAAARFASFSKAAEELHVTHGAVSRAIRQLEDHLGLKLFVRRTRQVVLTPVGATYAAGVRDALERLSAATRALARDEAKGDLTVSTLDSFASKWLVPRLFRFRRAHPEIDVRLQTSDREANFETDGVDLGIRLGNGKYPGLATSLLMEEDIFPVCRPHFLEGPHPLRKPKDLRHHTLIHDDYFISWAMWLKLAGAEDIDAERGPVFMSSDLAIQAAIQGDGVALARSALVEDDLIAGRLVKPFELTLPGVSAYYVVCPARSLERKKVRAFRDWLLAECAESANEVANALVNKPDINLVKKPKA
jgi:LysR family transcriptional regulator, glycine cleavage system transcriptional activator